MKEYQDRDARLLDMGFASYDAYLKSDLWVSVRAKLFELAKAHDKVQCRICGFTGNLIWHHMNYRLSTLVGNCLISVDVSLLCLDCHALVEFDHLGKKVDLETANQRLDQLVVEVEDFNPIDSESCFAIKGMLAKFRYEELRPAPRFPEFD